MHPVVVGAAQATITQACHLCYGQGVKERRDMGTVPLGLGVENETTYTSSVQGVRAMIALNVLIRG